MAFQGNSYADHARRPAGPGQEVHSAERDSMLIDNLRSQVQELEFKLGALHSSDINSLRRAYHSLTQHIQALDIESKHITTVIEGLEATVVTPVFVAEQVSSVACITAGAYTLGHLIRALKVSGSGRINGTVAVAGACLAGMRLAFSTGRRIMDVMGRNRRTKQQLQQDWRVVAERITLMADLAQADLARAQTLAEQRQRQQQPPQAQHPPQQYQESGSAPLSYPAYPPPPIVDGPPPPPLAPQLGWGAAPPTGAPGW